MTETALPGAAGLIAAARQAMSQVEAVPGNPERTTDLRRRAANRALDQWKPGINELTDMAGAARFLGLKGPDSLRRRQFRTRADGTPDWPKADRVFGRSKAWKYRTIVIHQAEAPGRGHPGAALGRTNQDKRAAARA